MSTGAVIFAFNNEKIDYVRLAAWSAQNISRHLDIPVSLITDSDVTPDGFDQIIRVKTPIAGSRWFDDIGSTVEWKNTNRVDAFELSPYDTTLVLDADYIVASPQLHYTLNSLTTDFLCFKKAYDLTGRTTGNLLNTFGQHNFPMSWATVLIFRRTHLSKIIFESMQMIKNNWQHYRNIYKIDRPTYRNDFALSIALGIFSGHTNQVDFILGSIPTITPDVELKKFSSDGYELNFIKNNKAVWLRIENMDFHAMGKKHLETMIENS